MKRIAGVEFTERTAVDATLRRAIEMLRDRGLRVAGVLQTRVPALDGDGTDLVLADIETERAHPILSDLGPLASGCRLDTTVIADVAGDLRPMIDSRPDLFVVNRFGKAEQMGSGLRQTIEYAVLAEVPMLAAVRRDFVADWAAFHGGMAETLPVDVDAIVDWATALNAPDAQATIKR